MEPEKSPGMLCSMGVPRSSRNPPGVASTAMAPGRRGRTLAAATLGAVVALVAASCGSTPVGKTAAPTTSATSTTSTSTSPPAQIPNDTTAGPLGPLQGGSAPVPAPTGPTVSIPTSIPADCSKDVSGPLKHFFKKLPANSTVLVGAQACYRVDKGIKLNNRQGLTIYGGTFNDEATTPGPSKRSKGLAIFTLVGGANLTFEAMKIEGVNPGGYHPAMAFASGINAEGTKGITIKGVTISKPFGDGITLSPLRGGHDHNSGTIVNPTLNAVIDGVTITGAGRQAVTLASVTGAQISDVVIQDPGLDSFDLEADQWNEGAKNVTIDGCTSTGGQIFFANGGAGSGPFTSNITLAHCAMAKLTAGEALLSINTRKGNRKDHQRGPLHFVSDVIYCGNSVYVGCVQLSGANATVENSVFHFPPGQLHERVYNVAQKSSAVFTNVAIKGQAHTGRVTSDSTVHIKGGDWRSVGTTGLPTHH